MILGSVQLSVRAEKSVLLGRLLRVDLIKWVSNVCPSVHRSFFDFNEIWYVGRGR